MSLLNNMPHTVKHERLGHTNSALGSTVPSKTTIVAEVECWIQGLSRREISEFQKRDQEVTHKIMFTSDPSLRAGDLLTPTEGDYLGAEFTFQAYSDSSAGLGVVWKAVVRNERNVPRAS